MKFKPTSEQLLPNNEQSQEEDEHWLTRAIEFEQLASNRIRIPERPPVWHPALEVLRNSVTQAMRKAPKRREFAEDFRGSVLWLPYWKGDWAPHRSRAMPLRVSTETASRALAFVNGVMLAAESREIAVSIDDKQGNFALTLWGCSLYFAVRERFEKEIKLPRNKTYGRSETVDVPTGRLFVAVQKPNRWQYTTHPESDDRPLNDLANLPFERLYSLVVHRREEERVQEQERQKQLVVQRELEALAAQRERERLERVEVQRLAAIERAKEAALLEEARNWESAALIRRYVNALSPPSTQEQVSWMDWAKGIADRLDPALRRNQRNDESSST